MKNISKRVAKEVKKKKADRPDELVQIKDEDLLSTGYAPLDVALSGKVKGGYGKGLFVMLVGDSSSGKTWLSQTCLAEAARNPLFDDYDFHFDDVERGNLINVRRFFGEAVARRMKPPRGTRAEPVYSETIEDLYYDLDDKLEAVEAGKANPFIRIVDSMDGLYAKDDKKKFKESKKAHAKGDKAAGTYGMAKAKANSVNLRMMIPRIEKAKCLLIVIFQTRANVDMFSFETKTRGGGLAPRFFAHLELWTSIKKKIVKKIKLSGGADKPRHIGTIVQVEIKKNRLTGWEGKLDMPFYKRYGIDDVGGCIDYLVEEGHWKKAKGINAAEFGVKLDREKLARYVQDNGLEHKLHLLVKKVFKEIEEKSAPNRKPRYT